MANRKNKNRKKSNRSGKAGNQQRNRGQQQAEKTAQQAEPEKDPREVVTLEFDDGREQECFVEGIFDCGGQDYMALVPDDKSGDVYIYRFIQLGDDDYRLEDETDDARFEAAVHEYEDLVGYKPAEA